MKTLKKLLVALLLVATIFPAVVKAEEYATTSAEADSVTEKEKAKVYVFRGEGCSVCKSFLEWMDSIEKEYGKYYELITFEVWGNSENSALMEKTAKYLGTEITGVPFIIIGEKTFPGYMDSWQKDIKDAIKAEYDKPVADRVDIIENVKNGIERDKPDDTVVSIIVVGAIVVFGGVLYFARKKSKK